MSLSNQKTILPLQHNPAALLVSDWSSTFKQTSKVKEGTGELKSHLNTIEEPKDAKSTTHLISPKTLWLHLTLRAPCM